ncbi:MAG: class A beta-lactamase [Pseudomonadota bacterium]
MTTLSNRRLFLIAMASIPFSTACTSWATKKPNSNVLAIESLEKLQREFRGSIGLFALDTRTNAELHHHADERFPVCSTFKVMLAAAILAKSQKMIGLMQQRIYYQQDALLEYAPITKQHIAEGMTVAELCAAAIQYSDNTAANLLMTMLGGPEAVTAYARSIGDTEFRLDRWETALNTATPGDVRDTSTPRAMGYSLQKLVLGHSLELHHREQLRDWLSGNTTGAARIKAGIPSDWKIGDKTGTGSYGIANDIAVVWPPHREPIVIAIYTRQLNKEAKARNDVIASAASIVTEWVNAAV